MNELPRFNHDKLRLLRESRCLSQSVVARNLKITQAAYSKLESGDLAPSEEMKEKIVTFFGYPVPYFFEGTDEIPSGLVFHRKRSALPAKERARIEAEARLRLVDVVKMLKTSPRQSNLIERDGRTATEMARALRKHWRATVSKPIENLVALLEKNNVLVLSFDFGSDKIDGFFLCVNENFVCIALNDATVFTPDRRRFTLAHELGHALLHRERFPDKDVEKEANDFAAEFLAPADAFKKTIKKPITLNQLVELKKTWKISMAAALYHAQDIGVVNEREHRRLCINLASLGYRKREPLYGIELEVPKLLEQIVDDCRRQIGEKPLWDYLNLDEQVCNLRYPAQRKEEVAVSP
ncbi:MAG: ImmA/IrrE family metallo-endopeptidase [Thermoguttaceae bacterium]|nr:ImmA/IrrE family metallo-endopeptidase [Thermoguttaceae bacterium]